jgi:hypothetical protein
MDKLQQIVFIAHIMVHPHFIRAVFVLSKIPAHCIFIFCIGPHWPASISMVANHPLQGSLEIFRLEVQSESFLDALVPSTSLAEHFIHLGGKLQVANFCIS